MKETLERTERQPVEVHNAEPEKGLTSLEVQHRRERGWENREGKSVLRSEGEIIAHHTLTFFNLVFVVLAVILLLAGSSIKNMTFLIVAVINTVIGCIQEIRAKRAVEKLTLLTRRPVRTVRDGVAVEVPSQELVRDDIVIFGAGDQICADGVLRTGQLQVNESLITGEPDAIVKNPGDNLLSGSFVVSGRGKCQLNAVGADAYAVKLSDMAKADPKAAKSEMMNSLDKLIRVMGIALVPIGIALYCQQFFALNMDKTASAEATVAALVGMIPEGLYLLTSVAMAVSALKLTRQKVLVQDMNCIETLARVDVLCVDKTGTITEPKMEVENVLPLSYDPPEYLERVLTELFSGGEPENDTAAALAEVFQGERQWQEIRRIPFASQHKWSGAVFPEGAFLVGAPESILGAGYEDLRGEVEPWQQTGYRVLLVARYHGDPKPMELDHTLVKPLALLLLTNRIRAEAPETFRYFAQQGVTIKVISGDNPQTVADVARRAGIQNADLAIDTTTLETDEEIREAATKYTVFGRVTPEMKKALIRALKKKGHTVAMTGDGVNDVLAMREANCAVAMAGGAQAAAQVAQLVLTESDFSKMPGIVAEGRRVVNNIQRAATLFLVKNIFSLGLSLVTIFAGLAYPVVPIHLTLISTLTIGTPSFFLALEPNYQRFSGHFLRGVLRRAFPGGLTNIFVVLAAQAFMPVFGLELGQIGTVSAGILAVVGMLVLWRVCRPFDLWRRIIWIAMGVGLLGCFTLLGEFFQLQLGDNKTLLPLGTLLLMTPTVFFGVQWVFDWCERQIVRFRERKQRQ